MVRKSPGAARMSAKEPRAGPSLILAPDIEADAAGLAALVADLAGDGRDVPAVLECLAACGLAGPGMWRVAPAQAAGQEPHRALRERLRRSLPLVGTIVRVLIQQPQFCLPMDRLVDLLRLRPACAGDIERHARAVIGWGACAGLFFHDAASDVVHLGLFDL